MKVLKHSAIVLAAAIFCSATSMAALAQAPTHDPTIVQSDANGCELNSVHVDGLIEEALRSGERVFVIARLGSGEAASRINLYRLQDARNYFLVRNFSLDRIVFAAGERSRGEGRIEFYLGGKLYLVSLAKRNRPVCLTCCDSPDGNNGGGRRNNRRR
jgi:hypothetical protein